MLNHITTHTTLLKKDREAFETMLIKHLNTQNKQQLAALKKEQYKLQQRLDELGKIFKKLYEDAALSRITDEEYTRLPADFISERQQAEVRLKAIATELAKHESDLSNVAKFIAVIEKIVVYEFRKENGVRKRRAAIHYRLIGNLDDYVA